MIPQKYLVTLLHQLPWLLPLVIYFAFRFVLLTASLLVMLRSQSLNYNIPGLLGCAALASVCDMIPFGGHLLAVGVLTFCVIKLTNAHFIDVRFTVAISYAVMFLLQMVILSAMPFELGANARTKTSPMQSLLHLMGTPDPEDVRVTAAPVKPVSSTNQTAASQPNPATAPVVATNNVQPTNAPGSSPDDLAKNFKLKGVVRNAQQTMAMIGVGTKTYTLEPGDAETLDTSSGPMNVSLEQVTEEGVVLKVGGTLVPLHLR